MTLLHYALQAQTRGLRIFPVVAGQKVPHPAAGKWGETATNDRAAIEYFWTRVDPQANIGVACKPSQLLVVDLDIPKEPWKLRGTEWAYMHDVFGPVVTGADLWDELVYQNGGHRPATATVRTGSGGIHLYYQWPAHWPQTSQSSPAKGVIDIRGNGGQYGGYVLGEGSVTDAGTYEALGIMHPALPPEWLRRLVVEKPAQPKVHRPAGVRQPSAVSWSGLVDSVENAGEGNRNNALLWAARAMYSDGAPEQECKDTLGPAAQKAGLPYYEVERTIESAYRIQRQKEGR